MSTVFRYGLLVVLAAVAGTACTTTRAEVALERPALDVPPPPPRTIVPLPPPPQSPRPEPVPDLGEPGTSTVAKPRPPREKEAPKTEPKPEEKPAEAPPPANPSPVPPLRIPAGGDPNEQAAQIRGSIDRTLGMLNGIDYGKLADTRKKQYDEAKLFATQADQALKDANLVVAKEFADKAERLTKELTSR